jgi:hypothetical protein
MKMGKHALQKKEGLDAIRGGPPAYSNFEIAAYLTEIILLGCVAMRVGVGKKLDWDGPRMRAKNAPEAAQYVRRESGGRPTYLFKSCRRSAPHLHRRLGVGGTERRIS